MNELQSHSFKGLIFFYHTEKIWKLYILKFFKVVLIMHGVYISAIWVYSVSNKSLQFSTHYIRIRICIFIIRVQKNSETNIIKYYMETIFMLQEIF